VQTPRDKVHQQTSQLSPSTESNNLAWKGAAMKRSILITLIALLLLPSLSQAQSPTWQNFGNPNPNGQGSIWAVSSDGNGGVWAGYRAGGRGISFPGGFVHALANGNNQTLNQEPFISCTSVNALSLSPNKTLWVSLSGRHDYGSNDYATNCRQFGRVHTNGILILTIASIDAQGNIQTIPGNELPESAIAPAMSSHVLTTDANNRLWLTSAGGVVYRESDGVWHGVSLWGANTQGIWSSSDGQRIIAVSDAGELATIDMAGTVNHLPAIPRLDDSVVTYKIGYGERIAALAHGRLLELVNNQWQEILKPAGYEADIAVIGKNIWLGGYSGLQRLNENNTSTLFNSSNLPLPHTGVTTLATEQNNLLVATYRGVARIPNETNPIDNSISKAAFERLWQRTNRNSQGTWVWGPNAWQDHYEPYTQSPGGARFVRYYDKTRMELNNPQSDPTSQWYITNGLLVKEMVEGRVQFGDTAQNDTCASPPFMQHTCPAMVPVAGDIGVNIQGSPTYFSFSPYLAATESQIGSKISRVIQHNETWRNADILDNPELASDETTIEYFDSITRHNIPRALWRFLNQQPNDWLYMFGHPISEAYWAQVPVGGEQKWVLIQLFERRSVTYTPSNPADWQVEMGNVGQHYYAWRYAEQPWNR
jgi:hypothetical protein